MSGGQGRLPMPPTHDEASNWETFEAGFSGSI